MVHADNYQDRNGRRVVRLPVCTAAECPEDSVSNGFNVVALLKSAVMMTMTTMSNDNAEFGSGAGVILL